MEINNEFYNAIKPTLIKLREKIGNEFVIFGSTPLYLIGVLEFKGLEQFNDLDIAIKEKSLIPPEAKKVTFQGNQNNNFYKITIDNINIDVGTYWPGQKKYFNKFFINPIIIDGFKFVNLSTIKEWKTLMVEQFNRKKDKKYLEKIQGYKKIQ